MKKILFVLSILSIYNINASATNVAVTDIDAFNEAFDLFAATRPGLTAAVESVREHQESYNDALNSDHLEEGIKLHGLRNYWDACFDAAKAPLQTWITKNGYKHFPTAEEHGDNVVAFTIQWKPKIGEIESLIKVLEKRAGNIYDEVAGASLYLPLLKGVQNSLTYLPALVFALGKLPEFDDEE